MCVTFIGILGPLTTVATAYFITRKISEQSSRFVARKEILFGELNRLDLRITEVTKLIIADTGVSEPRFLGLFQDACMSASHIVEVGRELKIAEMEALEDLDRLVAAYWESATDDRASDRVLIAENFQRQIERQTAIAKCQIVK